MYYKPIKSHARITSRRRQDAIRAPS